MTQNQPIASYIKAPHPPTTSSQYNPHITSQIPFTLTYLPLVIELSPPPGEVSRPPPHSPPPGAVPMTFHQVPPPPPPPPPPSKYHKKQPEQVKTRNSLPLYKQHSWSPDMYRDEAWLKRKGNFKNRRSKSVTDEDLDELKACFELGFGFDSNSPDEQLDPRLSYTLPALGLYYAVNNKKYYDSSVSKSNFTMSSSSSTVSECDTPSPLGSPHTIFGPGDNPQTVKTRLRQWAQVVACSVKQFSS